MSRLQRAVANSTAGDRVFTVFGWLFPEARAVEHDICGVRVRREEAPVVYPHREDRTRLERLVPKIDMGHLWIELFEEVDATVELEPRKVIQLRDGRRIRIIFSVGLYQPARKLGVCDCWFLLPGRDRNGQKVLKCYFGRARVNESKRDEPWKPDKHEGKGSVEKVGSLPIRRKAGVEKSREEIQNCIKAQASYFHKHPPRFFMLGRGLGKNCRALARTILYHCGLELANEETLLYTD